MSYDPAYATPNLPAAQTRMSKSSIASLVLGLLFCIPLVTSLAAILCAVIGFRATRSACRMSNNRSARRTAPSRRAHHY